MMTGFGDRLDVNTVLLSIAPTIFWGRELTKMGIFRINGEVVYDPSFRLQPEQIIEFD
jgi:ribosomal protein S4